MKLWWLVAGLVKRGEGILWYEGESFVLLLREEGREDIGLPASVARLAVGDAAQAVGEGCAGFDEGVAGGGDAAD